MVKSYHHVQKSYTVTYNTICDYLFSFKLNQSQSIRMGYTICRFVI